MPKFQDGKLIGKYNGRIIRGVEIGLKLWWDSWYWKPIFPAPKQFQTYIIWLCFRLEFNWIYGEYFDS